MKDIRNFKIKPSNKLMAVDDFLFNDVRKWHRTLVDANFMEIE